MNLARKVLGAAIIAGGTLTSGYFVYSEVELGRVEEHESKEIWREESFANFAGLSLGSLSTLLGLFVYHGKEENKNIH